MSDPHMDMLLQCKEVNRALPVDCWEKLPTANKRLSALIARWSLERAFMAVLISRNEHIPPTSSLLELQHAARVGLNKDQQEWLQIIDRKVTANEPSDEDDISWNGYHCCQLARGVVDTVVTCVALRRMSPKRDASQTPS
jgi:hypothetical protein